MACNDINSNCTDSCDQIDGLFEAASSLVQYRDILEKWLNGRQDEKVQIGGEQVKTLLGLIADIKQLVGVLPDGRTIILDDKRKVLSVLLAEGGDIKVKADGGLYVDVDEILVLGGGLAKDEDGKIYVDFSQMPTDKFEELLKQIRVPIWLSANKNFYVNGTTGNDTLDEGRGESEGKPFKTIQAAVEYIANNYNIGKYKFTVIVSHGVYKNDLSLPKYNCTTGNIVIKNVDDEKSGVVLQGGIYAGLSVGVFDIRSISIENPSAASSPGSKNFNAVNAEQGAEINLYNCHLDLKNAPPAQGGTFGIVSTGGIVTIRGLKSGRSGLSIDSGDLSIYQAIRASSRGYIAMLSDIDIQGQVANAVLSVSNLSLFDVQTPAGWEKPKFTGNVTGKRYQVTTNSIVSTGGGGPNFVVGTTDGSVSSGGQYN